MPQPSCIVSVLLEVVSFIEKCVQILNDSLYFYFHVMWAWHFATTTFLFKNIKQLEKDKFFVQITLTSHNICRGERFSDEFFDLLTCTYRSNKFIFSSISAVATTVSTTSACTSQTTVSNCFTFCFEFRFNKRFVSSGGLT